MKVLDLKLQAFGPFVKEQHIPFSILNNKGLFLINGPTGTGKTSIFDGIVYALYGKGSGKDRDDGKSMRSDFAKDDLETFVDLTFEANGQIYRIIRKPAYLRKKTRGEGTTWTNPVAELYMPDGSVISKPTEVDNKIINDILFVNHKQFKNIALLAQGEFTELVTASSKDRAKILEHIFQKEIYDDFQERVKGLFGDTVNEKNSVISSVNTLLAQVEDGENIIGYEQALADPSNIPDFLNNVNEYIDKLNEQKSVKETSTEELRKVYEESLKKLDALKHDNKQIANYLKAIKEQEELLKRKDEIENLKKQVELQQEVDALSPYVSQIERLNKDLSNFKQQIEDLKDEANRLVEEAKWLKENKEKYESTQEQINTLTITINNLKKIISQIADLVNENHVIKQKEAVFADDFAHFEEKERQFLELRNRFFASFSYNLAQQLEEGKPCPVCGSTSHPHPAESSDPVDEVTYKYEETRYNRLKDEIEKKRNELATLKASFKTRLDGVIDVIKESGYPEADYEFIKQNRIKTIFEEKNNELLVLRKFSIQYEERNSKLSKDQAKFEERTTGLTNSVTNTEDKIKEINETVASKLVENKIIKSLETFYEHSKNKIFVQSTLKEIEKYEQRLTITKTIIETTPDHLIEIGSVDESGLVEETNNKQNVYKESQTQLNELDTKIKNLVKIVAAIKQAYQKCEDVIYRYQSISELYKTASGANRLKLSFKMYILADYFDKIIVQANKRLSKITNGRYHLVRRNDVKGGGVQGLDLDVFDLETGKDRPASSLSGGEKFVSALSMALGLSDIIETNHALIQVESIFIDEGFGSLDENYLDMAMKALESLKEDNKTVAIISHVEKLKEYIPDGLEVSKADIGSKVTLKQNI